MAPLCLLAPSNLDPTGPLEPPLEPQQPLTAAASPRAPALDFRADLGVEAGEHDEAGAVRRQARIHCRQRGADHAVHLTAAGRKECRQSDAVPGLHAPHCRQVAGGCLRAIRRLHVRRLVHACSVPAPLAHAALPAPHLLRGRDRQVVGRGHLDLNVKRHVRRDGRKHLRQVMRGSAVYRWALCAAGSMGARPALSCAAMLSCPATLHSSSDGGGGGGSGSLPQQPASAAEQHSASAQPASPPSRRTSASVGKWSSSWHIQLRSVGSHATAGSPFLCLRSRRERPLEAVEAVHPLSMLASDQELAVGEPPRGEPPIGDPPMGDPPSGEPPRGEPPSSTPGAPLAAASASRSLMGARRRNSSAVRSAMRREVGAASSPYTT